MINWGSFFTLTNILLMLPVIIAGLYLMPLLYSGLVDAIMPWKEVNFEGDTRDWKATDRRKQLDRRNSERKAAAREALRRGDPEAINLIGRRKSDFEALGIELPSANS